MRKLSNRTWLGLLGGIVLVALAVFAVTAYSERQENEAGTPDVVASNPSNLSASLAPTSNLGGGAAYAPGETASSQFGRPSWMKPSPSYESVAQGNWVKHSELVIEESKPPKDPWQLQAEALKQRAEAEAILRQAEAARTATPPAAPVTPGPQTVSEAEDQETLAQLKAREAQNAARIAVLAKEIADHTGGFVNDLKRFPFPSGYTNSMEICNDSSRPVKVGMVWSSPVHTLELLGNPLSSGYRAAGFEEIASNRCLSVGFGAMKGEQSGYLSVFRWDGESWIADMPPNIASAYVEHGARVDLVDRWICWSDGSDRGIDPDQACPGNKLNTRFGVWFSRAVKTREFTFRVTEHSYAVGTAALVYRR